MGALGRCAHANRDICCSEVVHLIALALVVIGCWTSISFFSSCEHPPTIYNVARSIVFAHFGYLLVVPMTIWAYLSIFMRIVRIFVFTSSVASLRAVANVGTREGILHTVAGVLCSWLFEIIVVKSSGSMNAWVSFSRKVLVFPRPFFVFCILLCYLNVFISFLYTLVVSVIFIISEKCLVGAYVG